jgi:hypothetical protein
LRERVPSGNGLPDVMLLATAHTTKLLPLDVLPQIMLT